jgi:hypothetical protein
MLETATAPGWTCGSGDGEVPDAVALLVYLGLAARALLFAWMSLSCCVIWIGVVVVIVAGGRGGSAAVDFIFLSSSSPRPSSDSP